MTELEKVEKLREKANVSYTEAKEALEIAGGDVLDALIYLEKQGKAAAPAGGGYFSSAGTTYEEHRASYENKGPVNEQGGETFGQLLKRFGRFCLRMLQKGNTNFLEATKNGDLMFSCPVTVVVLFLIVFFWIVVPLFIITLFFGFNYSFRGADLGRESVNRVMDGASEVVGEIKRSFGQNGESSCTGSDRENCDE